MNRIARSFLHWRGSSARQDQRIAPADLSKCLDRCGSLRSPHPTLALKRFIPMMTGYGWRVTDRVCFMLASWNYSLLQIRRNLKPNKPALLTLSTKGSASSTLQNAGRDDIHLRQFHAYRATIHHLPHHLYQYRICRGSLEPLSLPEIAHRQSEQYGARHGRVVEACLLFRGFWQVCDDD